MRSSCAGVGTGVRIQDPPPVPARAPPLQC